VIILAALGDVVTLVGCGPAGQELQTVVGGSARLGGVGGEGKSLVGFEDHGLERQVEEADGWVAEVLDAGAVQADVVCGPQGAECFAAGGQFADQAGEGRVERVTACFGALQFDGRAGGVFEAGVELAGGGVEELEPGEVGRADRTGEGG
jgi:hypothetical protein